jgi:hypothetical protein
VLRLWPKEVQVGLFGDCSWLRVGSKGTVRNYVSNGADGGGMLKQLALMLDDANEDIRKGSSVVLTVSDALAEVICIQWQPHLHAPEERRRYAEICFEKRGREVDDAWLTLTEYRNFQANGIAYSLPAAWVVDAEKLIESRGLRLARVLPVSAAIYCLALSRTKGGRLGVMLEAKRISLLAYGRSGLESFEVEPVTAAPSDALRRLLRRVETAGLSIGSVAVWASSAEVPALLLDCLEEELPDVALLKLAREAIHAV